jgi:hypothetical protein
MELLPGKLKTLIRGAQPGSRGAASGSTVGENFSAMPPPFFGSSPPREKIAQRPSRGLEQFFNYIRDQVGLSILDLSGASQENVNFITNLGHKLYSEDVMRGLGEAFGNDATEQANPGRIEYFLKQNLDYGEGQFDGVLVWDALEYMAPPLLAATIDRLYAIVRAKSYLLAFFHVEDKMGAVPRYSFRIQDFNSLMVVERGQRVPAQLFNNRSLEKLFGRFESVKFFLTREQLREVIIKR